MEPNPEDIPKEELLQLCMKLNKRMQAMESKGKELFKKKNSLQIERQKLVSLLETIVGKPLQPNPVDADLDMEMIESSWSDWDQIRRESIANLERRIIEANISPNSPPDSGVEKAPQVSIVSICQYLIPS